MALMWNTLLNVNGVILVFVNLYFLYSIGISILELTWRPFLIALGFFLLFWILEVYFGIKAD